MFKKFVLVLLSLMLLCTSFAMADAATGKYTVYNETGEFVYELYLYKTGATEKGENLAANFKNNKQTITYEGDAADVLTLEFVTESGYTGTFTTLHVETAPISLLKVDATTGATSISFTAPERTGEYTIYNTTGEALTELYLYAVGSEDKGENLAENFVDGGVITYTGVDGTTLILDFTTESGYTGAFETLHIETTPISLLEVDATTGATTISFSAPEKTGEYTIYNTTGEALTELYLYAVGSEDKGENLAENFVDGSVITYTGVDGTTLILAFTTESGYTGAFETLHIETTPISLLAADALTGATAISFFAPAE